MKKENKVVREVISVDVVKEKLSNVLNEFAHQELGNRVTKFNMQGLANILLNEISKCVISNEQT